MFQSIFSKLQKQNGGVTQPSKGANKGFHQSNRFTLENEEDDQGQIPEAKALYKAMLQATVVDGAQHQVHLMSQPSGEDHEAPVQSRDLDRHLSDFPQDKKQKSQILKKLAKKAGKQEYSGTTQPTKQIEVTGYIPTESSMPSTRPLMTQEEHTRVNTEVKEVTEEMRAEALRKAFFGSKTISGPIPVTTANIR